MTSHFTRLLLLVGLAAGAFSVLAAQDRSPQPQSRDADVEAVRANAHAFAAAFNKGDAKAVAATWTEQGECHDADGTLLVGRPAIEQAFAEQFKEFPKAKVEVLIGSIRFPAPGRCRGRRHASDAWHRPRAADLNDVRRHTCSQRRPLADRRLPRVGRPGMTGLTTSNG